MTLKNIIRIMEFVYLNPERYNEDFIRNKFNEKDYLAFSQFCLSELAHYIGEPNDRKLKLTQKGVWEYHRLKKEANQERFNLLLLIATIILAFATSVLAVSTVIGVI